MSELADQFRGLPGDVLEMIRSGCLCEFATVSRASVPIDTPVGCQFTPEGKINILTGLSYPAKAERARKNPKVGLLIEGFPGEPTVLIAGMAAVRDANMQANVDWYMSEVSSYYQTFAHGHPWEVVRKAAYYWVRVIIEVTPKHIWWWNEPAAGDSSPKRWDAPAQTIFPASDPAPAMRADSVTEWGPQAPWQEQASEVVGEGLPSALALLGEDQFPVPFRVRSVEQTDYGFKLKLPAGVPWRIEGKATLCFMGRATFAGSVTPTSDGATLHVERALPTPPFARNLNELWTSTETRDRLMPRLEAELARRGQSMPKIPEVLPAPTAGSLMRAARMERLREMMADQGGTSAPYIRQE